MRSSANRDHSQPVPGESAEPRRRPDRGLKLRVPATPPLDEADRAALDAALAAGDAAAEASHLVEAAHLVKQLRSHDRDGAAPSRMPVTKPLIPAAPPPSNAVGERVDPAGNGVARGSHRGNAGSPMTRSVPPQPWQLGPVSATLPPPVPEKPAASFVATSAPAKSAGPDLVMLGGTVEGEHAPARDHAPAPPATALKPEKEREKDKLPSYMPAPRRRTQGPGTTTLALCAVGLVGVGIATLTWLKSGHSSAAAAVPASAAAPAAISGAQGSVMIVSRPEAAQVVIDGTPRGVTPLKISLAVGDHALELQSNGSTRSLPLSVESGTLVREYVDLSPAQNAEGRLEVTSEPAGAQVSIDGAPRGVTPLVVASIGAGQHKVTISDGSGTVNRTVNVAAGTVASVVASMVGAPAAASAGAGGWIAVKTPFEMQILEDGHVIGTTSMDRLMLPAGKHDLEFVNTAFEFRATVPVQIAAGKTASPAITLPKGTLSVNALPWAEVFVDGQDMGATPLGNLSVTIGTHEVVWRHPQLGERRATVKVTAQTPVRAGMDLSK